MTQSSSHKRVLFLSSCVHGGGAGKSLDTYLKYRSSHIEAHVVLPENGTMADSFHDATLHHVPEFVERIERCPWKWAQKIKTKWIHIMLNLVALPWAALKIRNICRKIKPDILYANHMLANPVALVVGWMTQIPVYFHQRNIHHYPVEKQFYRWMGARKIVKKIICNSYASALLFFTYSKDKTFVVYNSVRDDQYMDHASSQKQSKDHDAFVFGYVGRIIPIKGVNLFLEALIRVAKKDKRVNGLLVGGNDPGLHYDLLAQYQNRIQQEGLHDRIEFVGFQKDIRPYLAQMDMLVVPTLWPEPFGRVFIEAMAYDVPSMTTAWGGAIEVIEDGDNGLWFLNVDDLEASMMWCLDHPEEVKAMKAKAASHLQQAYLSSVNSKQIDALILGEPFPQSEDLQSLYAHNLEKAQAFESNRLQAFQDFKTIRIDSLERPS